MTAKKAATRKTAKTAQSAKKASTRKTGTREKAQPTAQMPQPMDASIKELPEGQMATNSHREAWALKTLVGEFSVLFPETPVEYSGIDGRNTALDASFDLTVLDEIDRETARQLLYLTQADARVSSVIAEDDQVLVSIRSNPRTQDSRETFGLTDAYLILAGEDEDGAEPDALGDDADRVEVGSW